MTRFLALLAAVITAAAVALTAIGGTVDPAPRPAPPGKPPPASVANRTAPNADEPAATRVAIRYALAARNWSARTVRGAWRRQYALAAGWLRRELARSRLTPSQLAALKAERRSQLATVTSRPRPRVNGRRADVLVELAERTATAGRAATYRTRNRARLRRTTSGWQVTGWTTLPEPEAAP